MSRERRNQILLVGLLVIFAGVMINQFVLSDDSSDKSSATDRSITARPKGPTKLANGQAARQQKSSAPMGAEEGYRQLPLQVLRNRSGVSKEPNRNVFVYYVPPPPPPKVEPPKPPPPLTIHSVNPLSVYARTKDFTLKVFGVDLPEDAQIYVNGRILNTTRVSGSELDTKVERRMIASPGQLQVEVKTPTGALYSNPLAVTIQAPPEPAYRYIGRIDNLVYLEKDADNRLLARLGETVDNRWRVKQITSDNVVLEDVILDIPYALEMERSTSGAPSNQFGGDFATPIQRTINPRRISPKNNPNGMQPGDQNSEEEEP